MLRSSSGQPFFAGRRSERPSSPEDLHPPSTSREHGRRGERPSSPEDLNPPTTSREHGRRGERPSSSGDTNPSNTVKGHSQRGESHLFFAGNKSSTIRQQARRGESPSPSSSEDEQSSTPRWEQEWSDESSSSSSEDNPPFTTRQQDVTLFYIGNIPTSTMKELTPKGESPSSSSEDDQPSTMRRQQEKTVESPSSSSEDEQPSAQRQQQEWRSESSSSSSEDEQPSTTRQQQEWRSESPSSSSEDEQPSAPRQQAQKDESCLFHTGTNPSTTPKDYRPKGESHLSCAANKSSTIRQQVLRGEIPCPSSSEDEQPSSPRWQEEWSDESPSSSSEDDQPSTTRQQEQKDVILFYIGNIPSSTTTDHTPKGESPSSSSEDEQPSTTRQQAQRGERPLSRGEFNPGEGPSSHLAEGCLERENERCENSQEEERRTFGWLSRLYIWWLKCKIDRTSRKIQSTFVDERKLLRYGSLVNPKKLAEYERLLDRRRELVTYKRRQQCKVEKEVTKQRLKLEKQVKEMENISELCCNPESPDL
ncbi:heat shock protein DDB_G0288861 [Etheostoma spectabile]|uniref:heat shock protein DDB_G0288861 n=1 Tax=Etheostoma spectabile TaxID=54343 RepID=UPI0013AFC957|nr:heat shock protein DDB_G0288861-like [Etheostoma spectabile]